MAEPAQRISEPTRSEGVFYMKAGTHADETLDEIVARKQREIEAHGYTLWGYGGTTCHPLTIVQPFAEEFGTDGQLPLFLERTDENYFAVEKTARQFSANGIDWFDIPAGIEVKGSRYALRIDRLQPADIILPLRDTTVPIGPNTGRRGDQYVTGLVDKACLEIHSDEASGADNENGRTISFVGRIRAPFAVFLKGYREEG